MVMTADVAATLNFGSDEAPGIRRRGTKRFTYFNELTGRPASPEDLLRIRALAVPPAWQNVWISADPQSHLQATGRDARGRKQYRYHPTFVDSQSENKFSELVTFGNALGSLRGRVDRDLRRGDLDHDRVVATVVRLLDITSLRIGNPEYTKANESFGLTTLRNGHVVVRGSRIRMSFKGKSAHDFDVTVDSKRLATIVRRCQDLPGQQLFEYRTVDGALRVVGSSDINRYLGEYAAVGITAKTFRTWNATVRAAEGLVQRAEDGSDPNQRVVNEVIDEVADHLGNTRAVCRNSYVHPIVVQSYIEGTLLPRWRRPVGRRPIRLSVAERKTLRLLR
jgi:DNA topoisomerase-1